MRGGIDLGGTKIEAIVIESGIEALGSAHIPIAEQNQGRIDAAPENDQREGETVNLVGGQAGQQNGQEWVEG